MTSTLLDDPPAAGAAADRSPSATRLRATMAAARVSFTWLGVRKSLTAAQKRQAADAFGAEGKFLSAGKKLLDTSHPAFQAVTAIKGRAQAYFKSLSLPYPEPAIRLIRQVQLAAFDRQLNLFQEELNDAVRELDRQYAALREAARQRLGELYNPADYPGSLLGLFAIDHDYPSVEPPEYLRQLNPELYDQECRRVQARFDEAVELAEQAFLEEFTKLIEHLGERLSGAEDGRPKVFRDSAITNLTTFFARFRQLNIRSNPELDELIARAEGAVSGVTPQGLREQAPLRQRVAGQFAGLQAHTRRSFDSENACLGG